MQCQLRAYHWQTRSFARHKASDELVEKIVDLSDEFVEALVGKLGGARPQGIGRLPPVDDLDDEAICDFLTSRIETLLDERSGIPAMAEGDPALMNVRDEIATALRKAAYLFTLR